MRKDISIILFVCFVAVWPVNAAVIFETNFDSGDDWTVTQPTSQTNSCHPSESCGMPNGFTSYENGRSFCSGIDEPGRNTMYFDTYAGYPSETNACYSGAKCFTFWDESCTEQMENSDGQIGVHLGQEYEDIYVRFKIRFKTDFELASNFLHKFYHIQHSVTNTDPFAYLNNEGHENNQPLSSGGLSSYADGTLYFYVNARCQNTYYCYDDINWSLGSISSNRSSGLLDGDWHTIEIRQKRNSSIGTANGLIELWIDGSKKSYVTGYEGDEIPFNDSGSSQLRGWSFVSIGGNTNNQFDTSCSNLADCEQWYAVDDVVISTTYVGTSYEVSGGGEESRGRSAILNFSR